MTPKCVCSRIFTFSSKKSRKGKGKGKCGKGNVEPDSNNSMLERKKSSDLNRRTFVRLVNNNYKVAWAYFVRK